MTEQPRTGIDQSGGDQSRGDQSGVVPVPRIAVVGVGGAGGNAIDNMIRAKLEGVDFIAANTDAQALAQSLCVSQIQLGATVTHGLGAGSRPEVGQAAAEESHEAIAAALRGCNMAFVTAGMGGGTGTGGAPVIARAARELGILTVGVVTKPFDFEGPHRMRQAETGIAELAQYVDTLIVIPNQNLFRVADEKTTFADAFKLADEVLHSGVRGVTDLMVQPGLVNLDFADVRAVMADMGKAVMGTGEAEGADRALQAAEAAIANPLLDDVSMKGARSVLINITGGLDLKLIEVDEAASRIRAEVDADANIIFGSAFNETLDGKIRVSVIATGGNLARVERPEPLTGGSPFVGPQPERSAATAAGKVTLQGASDTDDEEEPLTLRLVSSLPDEADAARDKEADGATAAHEPEDHDSLDIPEPDANVIGLSEKLRRERKPVKTQSVQQAVEAERNQNDGAIAETVPEAAPKAAPEAAPDTERQAGRAEEPVYFVVWEIDLGARIFKVPEGQIAAIQEQPHADRLKLFDSLDSAKVEANAIFKRIAAKRAAKGLPQSILKPTMDDIMTWNEQNVPTYFL